MINVSTNATQASPFKGICRPSQYESFALPVNEFLNIQSIVFAVINSFMALLAIFGNILILVAVWKTPSLRSPSYVLTSALALSDLGAGFIAMPVFVIAQSTVTVRHFRVNCIAANILGSSALPFAAFSFLTVTATSVERLLALRLHLRYQEFVTNKRVLLVAALFCIMGIACQIMRFMANPLILGSILIVGILVVMGVNVWSHWKIFQIVKIHQTQIHAQTSSNPRIFPNIARYKKSVLTMLYIYGFFLLCYFPFSVVAVATFLLAMDGELIYLLNSISHTVMFFNSSLNPFLFCLRTVNEMRQSVKQIIQK